jgi:predicted DNA-binding protein YlxM (UPF0122 family)
MGYTWNKKIMKTRKKNRPAYRRGHAQCQRIRSCLNILDQYHANCLNDPREQVLAMMMEEALTGKELDYLHYYYTNGMTQAQIACMVDRDASTITRVIGRGEKKLSCVMERAKLLCGEDFLK